MKMALVHDIAEAIVGDITPHCKVTGPLDPDSWQPLLHATCIA
jgi:5'-deoxynucleotidase YfbR-like HD superfamily hydrolase